MSWMVMIMRRSDVVFDVLEGLKSPRGRESPSIIIHRLRVSNRLLRNEVRFLRNKVDYMESKLRKKNHVRMTYKYMKVNNMPKKSIEDL
jgi:hypothetical protein